MALTMTEKRFREIKAKVADLRLARKAIAELAVTDWDSRPMFTSADAFLEYCDSLVPVEQPRRTKKSR
jgi:hypothetical protein